jgi:hypothetical protein
MNTLFFPVSEILPEIKRFSVYFLSFARTHLLAKKKMQ